MSSPHSLKFDLVLYHISLIFLWIFEKINLKIENANLSKFKSYICKRSIFLRNFFTKELEIHYSFYRIFLDFFSLFKIWKSHIWKFSTFRIFKIEKSPKFEFKNHRISNRYRRSHNCQNHISGCFQNCTIEKQLLSKLLGESSSLCFRFYFFLSKSRYKKQNQTHTETRILSILPMIGILWLLDQEKALLGSLISISPYLLIHSLKALPWA
jgi:hypothetical protein